MWPALLTSLLGNSNFMSNINPASAQYTKQGFGKGMKNWGKQNISGDVWGGNTYGPQDQQQQVQQQPAQTQSSGGGMSMDTLMSLINMFGNKGTTQMPKYNSGGGSISNYSNMYRG